VRSRTRNDPTSLILDIFLIFLFLVLYIYKYTMRNVQLLNSNEGVKTRWRRNENTMAKERKHDDEGAKIRWRRSDGSFAPSASCFRSIAIVFSFLRV